MIRRIERVKGCLFWSQAPAAGADPAEETGYLKAATAFLTGGNNIHSQNVFSTFGEFYLAGYGKGDCPEYWAAANPTLGYQPGIFKRREQPATVR